MSYGINVYSSARDVSTIRTVSFIKNTVVNMEYSYDTVRVYYADYPDEWEPTQDFFVSVETIEENTGAEYNMTSIEYDNGNRRLVLTCQSSSAITVNGASYEGTFTIQWFLRIPPPNSYGAVIKNDNDEIIISSDYSVYILESEGEIPIGDYGFGAYPEVDETRLVVVKVDPNIVCARVRPVKRAHTGEEVTFIIKKASASEDPFPDSIPYRVYKKVSYSDIQDNDYGIRIYKNNGELIFADSTNLAPSNGSSILFSADPTCEVDCVIQMTSAAVIDPSGDMWISYSAYPIGLSYTGHSYMIYALVFGRSSDGTFTSEARLVGIDVLGAGAGVTHHWDTYMAKGHANVFQ